MPKKIKGVSATSDRQLRRLAQQRTLSDLQERKTSQNLARNENVEIDIPATSTLEDSVSQCILPTHVVVEEHLSQETDKEDVHMVTPEDSTSEYILRSDPVQQYRCEETVDINFQSFSLETDSEPCTDVITSENKFNMYEDDEGDTHDDTMMTDDDCCSVLSNEYRYSDSDADSIPDIDFDFDINLGLDRNGQFREDVTHWTKQYQIPQNAIKALLTILNKYTDAEFPKDPRTLLQTPQSCDVVDMDSGQYCHIGVQNCLQKMLETRAARKMKCDHINLLVNIDGAPIVGNSSEKGLWVILMKDFELEPVYLVGVYCGTAKPEDPNVFLNRFVKEISELIENGLTYLNRVCNVRLHGLICDAPAKSFILCTKYHSGYSSCSKCLIKGKYFSSVCFPTKSIHHLKRYCSQLLRSDLDCRNLKYIGEYQRGNSIFCELPHFGLVSNVPLDSMHLVYVGITKQLIRHWIGDKGKRVKTCTLSDDEIKLTSQRLESLKHILPSDFNRRCRSLSHWKQWKATEFRHFLLYFGPAVLKDILKPYIYTNFLKLHIAMVIISNKTLVCAVENIRFAESLLVQFVYEFQQIYGKSNVTFNIHNLYNLLHLCKDVENFGAVENFSAFPFENYISYLKKLIRKGDEPLQQIAKRLAEYDCIKSIKTCTINAIHVEKLHYHGEVTNVRSYKEQYKILQTRTTRIDINDERNNCIMLVDGSIVNVTNIARSNDKLYFIGKKCEKAKHLFVMSDVHSSVLGIQIVKVSEVLLDWPCDMMYAKVFKIPCTQGFIIYPLIHTYDKMNKE